MDDKFVRLSDVQELKLKYAENDDIRDGWFGAIDAVMNLPYVDAVEVVRCLKCKMWTPINDEESYGWCELDYKATRKAMHFCGYGRCREDNSI